VCIQKADGWTGKPLTQQTSEPLDDGTALRLRGFQQGDVLPSISQIVVYGADGPYAVETPMGVVVLTQTCDVIRDGLQYVHVAPRERLSDSAARQAIRGRRPRYAHLPAFGDNDFADLTRISSVHKSVLTTIDRIPGVAADEEVSTFGKAVGRHFNRFAYPDEVNEFLHPFADSIQSKAGKLESPEGRLIERVLQLRLESVNGWQQPPYDLRLVIIVLPGTLPMFADDELPDLDEELHAWLYESDGVVRRSAHEIAERLEGEQGAAERYFLWGGLGDAWVARCRAKDLDEDSRQAAAPSITAEVVSADEFSLARMLDSEMLDLDHLSRPDGQPL
jgi:hypothetical protein